MTTFLSEITHLLSLPQWAETISVGTFLKLKHLPITDINIGIVYVWSFILGDEIVFFLSKN